MFGRRITIFRLSGFAVRLDASWLIIAALVVWSLATAIFPADNPGLTRADYWWMGLAGALGLFGSIVVHEFCHSVVARRYNIPMKGITLFVFGGVAEMGGEPQSAKAEFLMAAAGPLASVVIGFIFYVLAHAARGGASEPVVAVLAYLGWINWILAGFNLIPAFPLDGGRVLRSAIWQGTGDLTRATRIASAIGSGFAALLMVFALWQIFSGNFIAGIWYFLIAMFLRGAAQMSYDQMVARVALQGHPVRQFMHPDPVTVPPDASIQQLVDDYFYRYHYKCFPVVNGGSELAGCVTTRDVREVPREEWNRHTVREVMETCGPENTIAPDEDAMTALSRMQKNNVSRLMVSDRGRLVAILSLRDLVNFLATSMDLESGGPNFRTGHSW